MPNELSNFTMPDRSNSSGGYQAPPDVNAEGYVWDPVAKQYVKPGGTQVAGNAASAGNGAPPIDPLVWGGQKGDAQADIDRYRRMANNGNTVAPVIDQSRSGETRGLSMDALSMLRQRAEGAQTPADILAQRQTQGAVNGIQSGAASIRGGAGARAAAARGAMATGARVGAQGAQDAAAMHARGQADAANQLFGASSAQRGQDLTAATAQAKLEADQRVANDQRKLHYDQAGWNTGNAVNDATLGRSAAESAAMATAAKQNIAEGETARSNTNTIVGTGTSAVSGGVNAYMNTRQPGKSDDPWDPTNYSGSDPRMKTDIQDLSKAQVFGLGNEGGKERHWDRDVSQSAPDTISGASLSGPAPKYSKATPSTHAAHAKAATRKLSNDDLSRMAREMLGSQQSRGDAQLAEGPAVRDIAMSDPRAKRQAFIDGANHTQAMQDSGEVPPVPDYMEEDRGGPSPEKRQPGPRATHRAASKPVFATQDKRAQLDSVADAEHAQRVNDTTNLMLANGVMSGTPLGAGGTAYGVATGLAHANAPEPALAPAPSAAPGDAPGYFGQLVARARSMGSDTRMKTDVHGSPMADANRSMEPSSYEYKPEFTPPEQERGEVNVGPMANKMEADPVAKTAIVKDPETGLLAIDKTKALKLALGGLGALQRQVDRLQASRGGR